MKINAAKNKFVGVNLCEGFYCFGNVMSLEFLFQNCAIGSGDIVADATSVTLNYGCWHVSGDTSCSHCVEHGCGHGRLQLYF